MSANVSSPLSIAQRAGAFFGLLMLAGGLMADTLVRSQTDTFDPQAEYSPADEQGRFTYMIDFAEPSVIDQDNSRLTGHFERSSPANVAWRSQLQSLQARRIDQMSQSLGRSVAPSHHFLDLRNGIALKLTPGEAQRIASLDGVKSVERERVYSIDTFRGPDFIGAPAIWDGSATPDGSPLTGELMVVAILDSGIPEPATHPSFSNDPACGHGIGGVPDKVISFLDCDQTDANGLCNGADPIDENGHGTHVASTVAGNRVTNAATPSPELPALFDAVSGVANCAHIRSYDVCNLDGPTGIPGQQCGTAALAAGLQSVIIHTDPAVIGEIPPVTVMNYSISGGNSPWLDFDRAKLDLVEAGVMVSASAGNSGPTASTVAHLGPWVMSVASSTHDGQIFDGGVVSLDGGPQEVAAVEGSGQTLAATYTGQLRWAGDVDVTNNLGCVPFPANAFDGEAALIERGVCNFEIKVSNAINAGANLVIVFTDDRPLVRMGVGAANSVPSFMIARQPGLDMVTALAGGTAEVTVAPQPVGVIDPTAGDILSGFSSRGPTSAPLQDLQKPNITAPGDLVYAADLNQQTGEFGFGFKGGTSMSSPHVAGSAVLVRQANPDWTVPEVNSAIQMTASRDGLKDDDVTPWDWDDVGSGRVDLNDAALAGFVLDETIANYLAANPSLGGDVKTLNTPNIRNVDCSPSCSFTRTIRNTYDVATNWTVTVNSFGSNVDIQVTPATFSFTGDASQTQELTIDVAPLASMNGEIEFGLILFDEDGAQAPQAHFTTAIAGNLSEPPEAAIDQTEFTILVEEGNTSSVSFNISNVADGPVIEDLTYTIEEAAPASVVLSADREANPPQLVTLANDGFAGPINRIGVADQSILWFNQLTPGPLDLPFTLEAIQRIEFPNGTDILPGDVYDLYVWSDPDRIPGNGDEVLLTEELGNTIGAAPAFVSIPLSSPVEITTATGDVLIGVVNRTRRAGSFPANSERSGPYQNRAWIALDFPDGAAGSPPDIANAATFGTLADLNPALAGNWVIRGVGTGGSACLTPSEVPWLTVTPLSGSVAAGESQEVVIDIDSTGLAQGNYEARVCVNTNDPNNPVFVLPVTLEVTGAGGLPTIDVAPGAVDIAVDVLNPTGSETIDISNTGSALGLEWSIEEAQTVAVGDFRFPAQEVRGGSNTVIGTLDGSVALTADELRGATSGFSRGGPTISVDGLTSNSGYNSGDPNNSSFTLNIGAGNSVIGIGWEVNIVTEGPSWLSESGIAIVPSAGDETGLFLRPGALEGAPGDVNFSSEGVLVFADFAIAPIPANGEGDIYFERYEEFNDGEVDPDSTWFDSPAPSTLPPGLTLVCTDQAACDAAITGTPLPACDSPSDVSWLSVSPSSGTTAAGSTDSVTVNFDATGLMPGFYEAVLCINSNDPATPLVEVPVSMNLTIPANAAEVTGVVRGLGYCQADPTLAAGAGIEIVGAVETFNLTADANGFFSLYLDDANGPVDITATAPNHIADTEAGVSIAGGTTTVVDFGLVAELPCAQVAPTEFDESLPFGVISQNYELNIDNALGGAPFTWTVAEDTLPASDYVYGLPGGGEVVSNVGFARGNDRAASERPLDAMPFVDAAPQGAAVSASFVESFDDITTLPGAGWSLQNLSEPLGVSDWFQGNPAVFPAHEGDPAAYIGANFDNTAGAGVISNWLMTPEILLLDGTEMRFWTRVPGNDFPDRLEVRLSTSGSSTFAGASSADVGDFNTLLLSIDENLEGTYPTEWTEFTVTVTGLSEPTSGRLAFRYFVTDAGPLGANSSYIGIDTVSVNQPLCQSPSDIPWLSVTPLTGTAEIAETDVLGVSVDASELSVGTYRSFLCVETSDPEAGEFLVPFRLEIQPQDPLFRDRFEG